MQPPRVARVREGGAGGCGGRLGGLACLVRMRASARGPPRDDDAGAASVVHEGEEVRVRRREVLEASAEDVFVARLDGVVRAHERRGDGAHHAPPAAARRVYRVVGGHPRVQALHRSALLAADGGVDQAAAANTARRIVARAAVVRVRVAAAAADGAHAEVGRRGVARLLLLLALVVLGGWPARNGMDRREASGQGAAIFACGGKREREREKSCMPLRIRAVRERARAVFAAAALATVGAPGVAGAAAAPLLSGERPRVARRRVARRHHRGGTSNGALTKTPLRAGRVRSRADELVSRANAAGPV
mmetsp:Transcript_11083/g.46057  ORF Transcript_11083/g.46057 Transcript_11083/m.46057 type:complete len:305 (+) Transcript_11083:1832-2746(+)